MQSQSVFLKRSFSTLAKENLFKPTYKAWIGGTHYTCSSGKTIPVENPATEEILCEVESCNDEDVDYAVKCARESFNSGVWSKADVRDRAEVLNKAASLLRARVSEVALMESYQTGRAIREMNAQLGRLPEWLEYFAAVIRTHEGTVPPFKGNYVNYVTRVPLGVCAQITPWNHPMLIAIKKISVGLAAGNSIVLKPPELAPCSLLDFAEILAEAGLPEGVFNIVPGYGYEVGKYLCGHRDLQKVDLTGGTETGRIVGAAAGANLASVVSELGGKTPMIVFDDANIAQVVNLVCFGAFVATGQTCITGSRLLVQESVYDQLMPLLLEKTKRIRLGDPQDQTTQMGPVISKAQQDKILGMLERARADGGEFLCGGGKPESLQSGYYIEPTIVKCTQKMELNQEEVFGPVLSVVTFKDEQEAISLANDSPYGLAAAVHTTSVSRAHRVASQLDVGLCWINDHHRNDPSSPWGGMKDSGIGRENGLHAFHEYTQAKSVIVNTSDDPFDWFIEQGGARYG